MRTTEVENASVGKALSERWNKAESKMVVLLPKEGVSAIDAEGQPFEGIKERETLFKTIKNGIDNPNVKIKTIDCNINDNEFAVTAAEELINLMNK